MISFLIITKKIEGNSYLNECLQSLIPDQEVIIVETIQENKGRDAIIDIKKHDIGAITAKYVYDGDFQFHKARNYAQTLANGDWIMWLDDDERLLYNQHEQILKLIENAYDKVGGFLNTNIGVLTAFVNKDGQFVREIGSQCRLFRNDKRFQWIYPIHEQITPSIFENGFEVHDSGIIIHHVGYMQTNEELVDKMKRNLQVYEKNENLQKIPFFKENKEKLQERLEEIRQRLETNQEVSNGN